MKLSRIAVAMTFILGTQTTAFADSVEERLARMEAKMAEMQRRMDAQAEQIKEQESVIAQQQKQLTESDEIANADTDSGWFEQIELSGVVEVEASHHSPYQGDSESDVVLATFELDISSQVTDWVEVGGSLLYEEDETDLEVDTGYILLANPDATPLSAAAGQIYVPFGRFETNLISDPLTLEIGETRESTALLGFAHSDFSGSLYAFNGTNNKNGDSRIDAWGAALDYAWESDRMSWGGGIGYISDLGDSDTLQDTIEDNLGNNDIHDQVGGWTINLDGQFGAFRLIGEYLAATERFEQGEIPWKQQGAKPKAWNLEAGYGFRLLNKDATFAVAYQGTNEALAFDLPKRRWLLGLSVDIQENTALSFEWAHDEDYDQDAGGTDRNADTLTAQLAVDF